MGEIFTVERPAAALQFTGERLTSAAGGQIEYEHLHRYCFARLFCRGKDVVDVAAGEGYGSALLAQVARRVVGVEMAMDTVTHAIVGYHRPNLHFVRGDARHLPLQSDTADVVVSFETIEHLYEQELFLSEIRRILRPDGVLVISSPDSTVYSHEGTEVNCFHVRELTCDEFKQALRALFPNTQFYSQRALVGSAMTIDLATEDFITFERRGEDYVDASRGLTRAPYVVAVASAASLGQPCQTLYIDGLRSNHWLASRYTDPTAESVVAEYMEPAALRAALAAAIARAEVSEAREGAALEENDKQRKLISEITREREAAKFAAAESVHGELVHLRREVARLQGALLDAEGSAQEQARAAIQREAAAIANLVQRAAERTRAAAATEATLQAKVSQLAGELAGANAKLQRRFRVTWPMTEATRQRRIDAAVAAGDRAVRARSWAAAERDYRRALDLAPELTPTWVQLGHALKEQGETAGAEAAYRRALALDDSVADTHLQLGHLMKIAARWEEAADAYARALQLDPGLNDAASELDRLCPRLVERGDSARDARNWALAARCYQRALERQPELTGIWVQLGHAHKEQGEYPEAEVAYRRALALDPAVSDTHLQLGHLLNLQARRTEARDAYATAVRLDPKLTAASDALGDLLRWLPPPAAPVASARSAAAKEEPLTPAERYGALFAEASRKLGTGHDVIWLSVIDWHFRIQRPQHLATNLAKMGARVLYISLTFEEADANGRFRIVDAPDLGVFEIRMRLAGDRSDTLYQGLSEAAVGELQLGLDELIAVLGVHAPIVLVEHPAWHEVACGVPGATVVYDCLDLATGFSGVAESLAAAETAMLASADLAIAASRPLADHLAPQRSGIIIRNAADVDFFAQGFTDRMAGERPVIGYFGAIADWFNIEWIECCAAERPDWDFRLIGWTEGCDIARAVKFPNVRFYGETPYKELPPLLRDFDVAVIPFKLVELIRCTNPVKLYEYMAAGKPVVAARLSEVVEATDLVYIADDPHSFVERIAQALAEDNPAMRARRQEWARGHTWQNRARQLAQAIDESFPLVSVIVLTFNNWEYTKTCLFSLRNWSDYPNLEIIVVDNASTDETRDQLRDLQRQDDRLRVILNDTNLGFAAGNNVGLRAARGDYVILLNNDTYVTRGWLRDLIRPMQLDPRIGLTGPLTNLIGNEQKIKIAYRTMPEMEERARRYVRGRLRRTFEVGNLAFFCVAMRRSVLEEVGLLDEVYGLGYFEDDDYCQRARQANYKLVIVDDVFIHHHHSVSFDALDALGLKAEQMARNKLIFEERWGPWQPHRYRDEPGFG